MPAAPGLLFSMPLSESEKRFSHLPVHTFPVVREREGNELLTDLDGKNRILVFIQHKLDA